MMSTNSFRSVVGLDSGLSERKARPDRRLGIRSCTVSPLRRPNRRSDICGRRNTGSGRLRRAGRWQQISPVGPRPHLVGCRGRHEITVFSYLPSAAERAIDRDRTERSIGGGLSQAGLRLKQVLLGCQHGRKVGSALLVLLCSDFQRALCSGDTLAKISDLDPRLQEGRNAVVHLLLRLKDGVLIIDQ
jgi:hypothetical protein